MGAQEILIGFAAYMILTTLGLAGLYLTSSHRDTIPFQQTLFVAAVTLRFVGALVLHEPSLYQMIVGSADASGWEGALVFKETIDQSGLGPLAIPQQIWAASQGHNRGYTTLLGIYFYFTRLDSQFSAAALSCFSGAVTALMAYRLARVVFSEWVAVRVGWLVCVCPCMLIWSTPDYQGTERHSL